MIWGFFFPLEGQKEQGHWFVSRIIKWKVGCSLKAATLHVNLLTNQVKFHCYKFNQHYAFCGSQ